MPNEKNARMRKRLFVNSEIQFGLIRRTIIHWGLYMIAVLLAVMLWFTYRNHDASISTIINESFVNFAPALFAGVVLLPIFLYDQLKFSQRMVGPIYRMRREMSKLIRGEGVQKIRFRNQDHWPELADEFNRLAAIVIRNRRSLRNTEEKCHAMVLENRSKKSPIQLDHHEPKLFRR